MVSKGLERTPFHFPLIAQLISTHLINVQYDLSVVSALLWKDIIKWIETPFKQQQFQQQINNCTRKLQLLTKFTRLYLFLKP